MLSLILAALFFLGIHLLVSGTPLRDRLTGAIGENAYLGLFSLASLGGIAWLCMAYNAAYATENSFYWMAPTWATHLGSILMLIAFLFAVIGVTTPNPTAVKAEEVLDKPHGVEGMLRVTRHPFLMGVALWALFHFVVNGDLASLIFFGTFLVLSVLGPFSIDAKRRRKLGAKWDGFAHQTSVLPFAAIVGGRNKFVAREFALWRILAAIGAWAVILYGHQWLFGVSPIPGASFY